jgi:hypothetical protein
MKKTSSINRTLLVLFTIFSMILLVATACETGNPEIYVSPEGSDDNKGSIEAPFLNIERAKTEVRKINMGSKVPIKVFLRGGSYNLTETLVFDLEDSGSEESPVTYQAYQDEVPVITSAVTIEGWKKAGGLPDNYPESTRNQIWVAKSPTGFELPKYLFQDGNVLPRSTTRGFISPVTHRAWRGKNPSDRNQFVYEKGIIRNWDHIEDMELALMPTVDWTWYNLPLQSVIEDSSIVRPAIVGAYALGAQSKGVWRDENTSWFTNCPEGMLEEGNWYASQSEGLIYLVSSSDTPPSDISAPALQEYFKIEGAVGKDLEEDTPVRYLNFNGLVFMNGERDTWDKNHNRNHIQHEWERYDHGDALLRFRGAENCVVSDCRFINSGGGGIRLDLYCQNIVVENSDFFHLGGCGVLLCGYGIGYKDVNKNNTVRNNHISYVGEAYQHSAAVTIFQSGENKIANNTIHNTPYNSIVVTGPRQLEKDFVESGTTAIMDIPESRNKDWEFRFKVLHSRNNMIENNDISFGVEKLGDGNIIYLSGCGENNIIRYNYIHDIVNPHASAAVRTDAMTRSVHFENNLFYNINHSAIALKDVNHANDNIIIDACMEHGFGYLVFRGGPTDGSEVKNNIFIKSDSGQGVFISERRPLRLPPVDMSKAIMSNNVFFQNGLNDQGKKQGIFVLKTRRGNTSFTPYDHTEDLLKFAIIDGITVSGGKPDIDLSAPIFKQGHKHFDLSKVGLISINK